MDSQNQRDGLFDKYGSNAKIILRTFALLLILGLSSVAYIELVEHKLNHTALLFVGLPTVMAFALVLTPSAKSITGGIVKGMSLALLISVMFLGEGVICILMSLPLFYFIAVSIGAVIERRRNKSGKDLYIMLLPTLLIISSMEGVVPELSFNRNETVSVERIVNSNSTQVENQLARLPVFLTDMPFFLRLGFPVPIGAEGKGLDVGDRRLVRFQMNNKPEKTMIFEIISRTHDSIQFGLIEDQTKVSSWLSWRDSTVTWVAIDDNHTRVTWSLTYERHLDPFWYFDPLMQYTVAEVAEYLINNLATPRD